MSFCFFVLIVFVAHSVAQGVVNINVGAAGSFFDPDSVNAHWGDIVRFTFSDATHGVVQSSFENPCVPLPGGFSSGIIKANTTNPVVWDLVITDDTKTIWFYCQLKMPSPHCAAGMVGAINPTGGPSVVDLFKAAAKVFSGTPASPSRTLSGIGAFASAPPVTSVTPSDTDTGGNTAAFGGPSTTLTNDVLPKSQTTATETPTNASSTSSSSDHTGAIAGGVVGGSVALILVFVLTFSCIRRRRKRVDETIEKHYFPASPPSTSMSETFPGKISPFTPPAALNHSFAGGRPSQDSGGNYTRAQIPTMRPTQPHPYASPELSNGNQRGTGEINTLAREVAAVLREQSSNSTLESGHLKHGHGQRDDGSGRGPPPDYKSRSAVA